MRRPDAGQRARTREPRPGGAIRATEPLAEQRRARRAREGPRQLPGVGGGGGLARQVRRFLQHRPGARRELHRATEAPESGDGRPSRELEQPARGLQARDHLRVERLGQRHLEPPQPGLVGPASPGHERTDLGGGGSARSLQSPVGLVEIAGIPREASERGLGRSPRRRVGRGERTTRHRLRFLGLASPPCQLPPERVGVGPFGRRERSPGAPGLAGTGQGRRQGKGHRRRGASARELVLRQLDRPRVRRRPRELADQAHDALRVASGTPGRTPRAPSAEQILQGPGRRVAIAGERHRVGDQLPFPAPVATRHPRRRAGTGERHQPARPPDRSHGLDRCAAAARVGAQLSRPGEGVLEPCPGRLGDGARHLRVMEVLGACGEVRPPDPIDAPARSLALVDPQLEPSRGARGEPLRAGPSSRRPRDQGADPARRLPGDGPAFDRGDRVAGLGYLGIEDLRQHEPEGPEVRLGAGLSAVAQLRRRIARRPPEDLRAHVGGEAEVDEGGASIRGGIAGRLVRGPQHVLRLHVAMAYPRLVQLRERPTRAVSHQGGEPLPVRLRSHRLRIHGRAGHPLGGEEARARVDQGRSPPAPDARQQRRLAGHGAARGVVRARQLEGHELPPLDVPRPPDHRGGALPDPLQRLPRRNAAGVRQLV